MATDAKLFHRHGRGSAGISARSIISICGAMFALGAALAQTPPQITRSVPTSISPSKPELAIQAGHADGIHTLIWSPDGKWLASAGFDRTVRVWDAESGVEFRTLATGSGLVNGIAFNPVKPWLVVASNALTLWDLTSGAQVRKLEDSGEIFSFDGVAFSPDGKRLAAGAPLGDIKLRRRQGSGLQSRWPAAGIRR
jgi:WD40 repeat protein